MIIKISQNGCLAPGILNTGFFGKNSLSFWTHVFFEEDQSWRTTLLRRIFFFWCTPVDTKHSTGMKLYELKQYHFLRYNPTSFINFVDSYRQFDGSDAIWYRPSLIVFRNMFCRNSNMVTDIFCTFKKCLNCDNMHHGWRNSTDKIRTLQYQSLKS